MNPEVSETWMDGKARIERQAGGLGWIRLILLFVAIAAGPAVILPFLSGLVPAPALAPSYLPALEANREREVPFRGEYITELQVLKPRWVFIGDSMLGTRIDPTVLSVESGKEGVAMIMQAGSGSAWWYLALKNTVVASGVKPRYVFVFFRDENLTDPMFRATDTYRWSLDWVARDHEPELNDVFAAHTSGPWFRVHDSIERAFDVQRLSLWADRKIRSGLLSRLAGDEPIDRFEARVNAVFDLDHLRPIPEADMQKADDARLDFNREVDRSVLPLMLKLSKEHTLPLVFVRVQRRPTADGPPPESPAMKKYVSDMRSWLEARGALFYDDTGAKELTLSLYEDGDHIDRSAREFYTEWFRRRAAHMFE